MPAKQYPDEINKYKNEWVTLSSDDRILGHGKTPEEAISSAKVSGVTKYTLVYIPDKWPNLMTL